VPSTKQTPPATAKPGALKWTVEFHREVGKDVVAYGLRDRRFSPTLGELVTQLERDPKQFAKKKGALKNARAADLRFQGTAYRAVFTLDEVSRTVFVIALDPHDTAYVTAEKRIAARKTIKTQNALKSSRRRRR
jgi:mRNA-degrading endonuclease RelE of RelBE toxin-antitoxin system